MKKYLVFSIPAAAAMLALGLWLALPAPTVTAMMFEAGWVETVTLFAYAAAIVAVGLTLLIRGDRFARAAILLLLVALGAREMDLHMALTGTSVLRVSYYLRGAFSPEKGLALAAVALVLACVGYLLRHYAALFWRGVRTGHPIAWALLAFLAALAVAKVLDRCVTILRNDFGVAVTPSAAALVLAMEEMLELSLPVLVVFAAVHYLRAARPALETRSSGKAEPGKRQPLETAATR